MMLFNLAHLALVSSLAGDGTQWLEGWSFRPADEATEAVPGADDPGFQATDGPGPWGPLGSSGYSRTRIGLKQPPQPGSWLLLLSQLPESTEVYLNQKRIEGFEETAIGLFYGSFDASLLEAGENSLVLRLPERTAGTSVSDGPYLLAGPENAVWIRETLQAQFEKRSVVNFAAASAIDERGLLLPSFWVRSRDSDAMEPVALLSVFFGGPGPGGLRFLRDFTLESAQATGAFPQRRAEFSDKRFGDLKFQAAINAPAAPNDLLLSSLPVVQTSIRITTNSETPIPTAVEVRMIPFAPGPFKTEKAGDITLVHNGRIGIGLQSEDVEASELPIPTVAASDEAVLPRRSLRQVQMDLYVAFFDAEAAYAETIPSLVELVRHVRSKRGDCRRGLRSFRDRLPSTGDPELDRDLSRHLAYGMEATGGSTSGKYRVARPGADPAEAYWTSYFHLLWYHDLELEMARRALQAAPKREATAQIYALLRAERAAAWLRDGAFLEALDPLLSATAEALLATDRDGDGLSDDLWNPPTAGVNRLADLFAYLACLQKIGERLKDGEIGARLLKAWEASSAKIHKGADEGGLWRDDHYGEPQPSPLQLWNQVVGIVLEQIPSERIPAVLESLKRAGPPQDPRARHFKGAGVWAHLATMDPATDRETVRELLAKTRSSEPSPAHLAARVFGFLGLRRDLDGTLLANPYRVAKRLSSTIFLPEGALRLTFNPGKEDQLTLGAWGKLDRPLKLKMGLREETSPATVEFELDEGKKQAQQIIQLPKRGG